MFNFLINQFKMEVVADEAPPLNTGRALLYKELHVTPPRKGEKKISDDSYDYSNPKSARPPTESFLIT
jgi:hypothetical protein